MKIKVDRDFPTTVSRDFFHLITGERLGSGIARDVYECNLDQTLVIKIEKTPYNFQNVKEAETWKSVEYTKFAKWFAPCIEISPNGVCLTQRRTTPITLEQFPEEIPVFFTDLKLSNWGMLDGRPVCHDYGLHKLLERGLTSRMQKVNKDCL